MSLPLSSESPAAPATTPSTAPSNTAAGAPSNTAAGAPSNAAAVTAAAAVEWDLVRDTVRWSAAAYPILARDPELGPLTLDQLPGQLVPQDRPALCRMVTEALVHGRPLDGVVRIHRPTGPAAAVHCSGRPVLGPDGQVVSLRMRIRAC
ncbi:PAS domain-containing protein [Kitasatospora sp. NBC_01287]|uniref:hypothetical protein n=1 Tax=Kitasatospora sp. NBC_01287 TaxID=2903573 RepID=UPI002251831F|nr:hypothetical protein [Kitasatospora sp. NBC_01287]MCX4750718.1 PAS domain-containing protein [Kitasatospora sp. NBC_01287]